MTEPVETSAFRVLLVEDNPADVFLARQYLERAGVPLALTVAKDGGEALRLVRQEGTPAGAPRPELVLLDLNLPVMSGTEVLAAIKGDPMLRAIPVVVFSTSNARVDAARCYDLGASAYVVKPGSNAEYARVMGSLLAFWCGTALLASRCPR